MTGITDAAPARSTSTSTGPGPGPSARWTTILDGHRLRQLRQQRHLTRAELAHLAGISPATIAKLERQLRPRCRGRTLARLAAALGEQPPAITPSPPGGTRQTGPPDSRAASLP